MLSFIMGGSGKKPILDQQLKQSNLLTSYSLIGLLYNMLLLKEDLFDI